MKEKVQEAKALLQEKSEILRRFFEQSKDGLFSYNKELRIIDCNNALIHMFNLEKVELFQHELHKLKNEDLALMIKGAMADKNGKFAGTYINHQGKRLWLEIRCPQFMT